ncbi:hypothetical protein [Roseinatronobacter monicus]|uniref:hypothetical protein n=1 Tax=Roseinatronobacter monicus TaxID=393481 RepID=UPI003F30B5D7
MKYIPKNAIKLRIAAAKRLRTIRRQLQAIDLSISIEINLIFLKITFTAKRRT